MDEYSQRKTELLFNFLTIEVNDGIVNDVFFCYIKSGVRTWI